MAELSAEIQVLLWLTLIIERKPNKAHSASSEFVQVVARLSAEQT